MQKKHSTWNIHECSKKLLGNTYAYAINKQRKIYIANNKLQTVAQKPQNTYICASNTPKMVSITTYYKPKLVIDFADEELHLSKRLTTTYMGMYMEIRDHRFKLASPSAIKYMKHKRSTCYELQTP